MEDTEIEKPLQRRDVLKRLKTICAKLEKWALQKKPVAAFRIKAMRTAIYGYSVAINALKDEEVELRLKELEKKLEVWLYFFKLSWW